MCLAVLMCVSPLLPVDAAVACLPLAPIDGLRTATSPRQLPQKMGLSQVMDPYWVAYFQMPINSGYSCPKSASVSNSCNFMFPILLWVVIFINHYYIITVAVVPKCIIINNWSLILKVFYYNYKIHLKMFL